MRWVAVDTTTNVVEMTGDVRVWDENTEFPEGYLIVTEAPLHVEPGLYYYINGEFTEKSESELLREVYHSRIGTIPDGIFNTMSDEDLDIIIDEYFMGNIDVTQWRVDNYVPLREIFYPPYVDYLDAQVKINCGVPEIIVEGETELTMYYQRCYEIKIRFPKGK